MDNFNLAFAINLWMTILMLASLILFIEAAALVRSLLRQRRSWWQYLLILLPLSVSIQSFAVAQQTPRFTSIPPIPVTLAYYLAWEASFRPAIAHEQFQTALAVGVFVITLVVERMLHLRYIPSPQRSARPLHQSMS